MVYEKMPCTGVGKVVNLTEQAAEAEMGTGGGGPGPLEAVPARPELNSWSSLLRPCSNSGAGVKASRGHHHAGPAW
jgi:hypothetical protein